MNETQLKRLLKSETPEHFVSEHIFGGRVWLFEELFGEAADEKYKRFRQIISTNLNVPITNVWLVGSAKLGISMNVNIKKKRFLKAFDEEKSDIDVVVVSDAVFGSLWNDLLTSHYSKSTFPPDDFQNRIFCKYIYFEHFLLKSTTTKLVNDWLRKTGPIQRQMFLDLQISNYFNFRLYKDIEAAKLYHQYSVRMAKETIADGRA